MIPLLVVLFSPKAPAQAPTPLHPTRPDPLLQAQIDVSLDGETARVNGQPCPSPRGPSTHVIADVEVLCARVADRTWLQARLTASAAAAQIVIMDASLEPGALAAWGAEVSIVRGPRFQRGLDGAMPVLVFGPPADRISVSRFADGQLSLRTVVFEGALIDLVRTQPAIGLAPTSGRPLLWTVGVRSGSPEPGWTEVSFSPSIPWKETAAGTHRRITFTLDALPETPWLLLAVESWEPVSVWLNGELVLRGVGHGARTLVDAGWLVLGENLLAVTAADGSVVRLSVLGEDVDRTP